MNVTAKQLIEGFIRDDQIEDAVMAYEADHDEGDEPSNDDAKKYLARYSVNPEIRAINRFHEIFNSRTASQR